MITYKELLEAAPDKSVLKKLGLKPSDVTVIDSPSKLNTTWLLQVKDTETVQKAWEFAKKNIKGKWKKGATRGGIATDGGRIPNIEFDWKDLFVSFPKDFK